MSYSDNIELIGALFIKPANHLAVVCGKYAGFDLNRMGLAGRKDQEENWDDEREQQKPACSVKEMEISCTQNTAFLTVTVTHLK